MKLYGLRHKVTKNPLGVDSRANDPEAESCSVSFTFQMIGSIPVWLVLSREYAERALTHSPAWYNADYMTPEWPSSNRAKDYEVFEVEI